MSKLPIENLSVGIVGTGFLAQTRARCWQQVPKASVLAVTSGSPDNAKSFAERNNIANACDDLSQLLELESVDLVDLCVPNLLHRPMTEQVAAAGKHVLCTKPLTAYVGQDLPDGATDEEVSSRSRQTMFDVALADAQAMIDATQAAGVHLFYGENWLYAPAFERALALLESGNSKVLEMRGGESHSGSHSPYSKLWRNTGGGALLRLGSHPVGAMLHIKRLEGLRTRSAPIRPVRVSAEVADLTRTTGLDEIDARIATGWVDVENWGSLILEFEDGSRGVAWGSDNQLGGMESRLDLFASNCRLQCNLSPGDLLRAYAPDGEVFGDSYIMEKIDSGAGWTTPMPDEDWTSGQLGMLHAFAANLRKGTAPASDGELGLDVVAVLYGAYRSAEEGRRIEI